MDEARRLALIVASSEFSDPTLQRLVTPGLDAKSLARVLGDPAIGRFDVHTLVNRPASEILREIEAFFAERKKGDLTLLYFSGHGVKDDDGRLYLAATDTRRGLFRSTAVPATFINESMSASRSRQQVLILDCCHSGAFARGMVAKGGESVDLRERFEGRGRVVLTASNSTQYAFQGDDILGQAQPSIFTRFLVRGLETGEADQDGDGWVALDELYDYVYERVVDETPRQTPGKWAFDLQGDILIAANPHGSKPDPGFAEAQLAASYADGLSALTSGQWKRALEIFERLEELHHGYRDCAAQVTRLRPVVAAMERPAPPPSQAISRPRPDSLPMEPMARKPFGPSAQPAAHPRPDSLPEEKASPAQKPATHARPDSLPEE
jgi:hypothetical protein